MNTTLRTDPTPATTDATIVAILTIPWIALFGTIAFLWFHA